MYLSLFWVLKENVKIEKNFFFKIWKYQIILDKSIFLFNLFRVIAFLQLKSILLSKPLHTFLRLKNNKQKLSK